MGKIEAARTKVIEFGSKKLEKLVGKFGKWKVHNAPSEGARGKDWVAAQPSVQHTSAGASRLLFALADIKSRTQLLADEIPKLPFDQSQKRAHTLHERVQKGMDAVLEHQGEPQKQAELEAQLQKDLIRLSKFINNCRPENLKTFELPEIQVLDLSTAEDKGAAETGTTKSRFKQDKETGFTYLAKEFAFNNSKDKKSLRTLQKRYLAPQYILQSPMQRWASPMQ